MLLLIIVLAPLFVSSLSKVTDIGLASLIISFILLLKVRPAEGDSDYLGTDHH